MRPRGMVESDDPDNRLGVFKRYEDVPEQYRLDHYERTFEGRDVWAEWFDAERGDKDYSERTMRRTYNATEDALKQVAADAGRHHALVTPAEIQALFETARAEYAPRTTIECRLLPLMDFFEWLTYHTEYPHRYNVLFMAAAESGPTADVWADYVSWKNDQRARKRQ